MASLMKDRAWGWPPRSDRLPRRTGTAGRHMESGPGRSCSAPPIMPASAYRRRRRPAGTGHARSMAPKARTPTGWPDSFRMAGTSISSFLGRKSQVEGLSRARWTRPWPGPCSSRGAAVAPPGPLLARGIACSGLPSTPHLARGCGDVPCGREVWSFPDRRRGCAFAPAAPRSGSSPGRSGEARPWERLRTRAVVQMLSLPTGDGWPANEAIRCGGTRTLADDPPAFVRGDFVAGRMASRLVSGRTAARIPARNRRGRA